MTKLRLFLFLILKYFYNADLEILLSLNIQNSHGTQYF